MCDLFEIQDNNINYYHYKPGEMLLSYISKTSHTQWGKNKHVTEGHLTLFVNTFPNFSQSISDIHDSFFMVHRLYHKLLIS